MNKPLNLDSGIFEKVAIERIIKYVDSSYSSLYYNKKKDDFDFTNVERTWALEHTSYIISNEIEVHNYEKARLEGKSPDPSRIEGVTLDSDGDVLAYYGESMSTLRRMLLKAISKKNAKCKKRLLKEKSFTRVELVVTVPDDPLFDDEKSIKPLDEWIKKLDNIFTTIYIIFYSSIFIFNGKTGEYKYVSYKYNV